MGDVRSADADRGPRRFSRWQRTALTVLACTGTTLLATPLIGYLDLANIVMLFLLTVLLIAVGLGRSAAVLAAVLSVLLFDVFFVPPRFSLAVSNAQYLVTFAVMLVTALITGQLAAGLQQQAREARWREQRTQALYEVARQLAGTLALAQVVEIVGAFVRRQTGAAARILLPLPSGGIDADNAPGTTPRIEIHLANMALAGAETIRNLGLAGSGYASLYLPLRASMRVRGVLAVAFATESPEPSPEDLALLEALSSLVAVAVERLHYVETAHATQLTMVAERLRSSILSALSHDLRTPLTALVGLADALFLVKPPLAPQALDSVRALHEQATRLANLVGNLLDMARLNAGNVALRREWQPLEEVIGASIKLLDSALTAHPVHVVLPPDLPLLEFDAVLLERVFCNLLENAAKYAPPGSTIEITAREIDAFVEVAVCDGGPGFPATAQNREELFAMFVRGRDAAAQPGAGLGLAICRAIVEAHGGKIGAENRPTGGACVCFSLPKGVPPLLEQESE